MSELKRTEPNEGSREEVVEYRSLAGSAIATLVLGILSFLAIFKPILWVFPLITCGVGFASLSVLAKNPLKMGRQAALVGLALAFFFLAWGGGHYFSRQQWIIRCARQYADAWLETVRAGQLRDAHQLHLPKSSRIEAGKTVDEYYATHPFAQSDFDSFFEKESLKTLRKLDPSAKVVFQRVDLHEVDSKRDKLYLNYRADYQESGRPREVPLQIVMIRRRDRNTGDLNWHVESVDSPGANR